MGRRVIPHWYDWRLILAIAARPRRPRPSRSGCLARASAIRDRGGQGRHARHPGPDRRQARLRLPRDRSARSARGSPGSEANARQRKMVADHFTKHGRQGPRAAVPGPAPAHRPARQHGQPDRLVASRADRSASCIGAHYDTRPCPDQEDDPERLNPPFLGANDGASGVALLMEIANHLDKLNDPLGRRPGALRRRGTGLRQRPAQGEYFLGSKAVRPGLCRRSANGRGPGRGTRRASCSTWSAARNLTINQEPNSLKLAPDLVRDVWAVARQLKARSFSNGSAARSSTITCRSTTRASPPSTSSTSTTPTGTSRRPARELLGREPGRGRPGRHRLARPAEAEGAVRRVDD